MQLTAISKYVQNTWSTHLVCGHYMLDSSSSSELNSAGAKFYRQ